MEVRNASILLATWRGHARRREETCATPKSITWACLITLKLLAWAWHTAAGPVLSEAEGMAAFRMRARLEMASKSDRTDAPHFSPVR